MLAVHSAQGVQLGVTLFPTEEFPSWYQRVPQAKRATWKPLGPRVGPEASDKFPTNRAVARNGEDFPIEPSTCNGNRFGFIG